MTSLVNCLCIIDQYQNNDSWLKLTILRIDDNADRFKELNVYCPNIISLTEAYFTKNKHTHPITYHNMDTEKYYIESRAYIQNNWVIWNDRKKQFSRSIESDKYEYWIVTLPRDYWNGIIQ